MPVTWCLADNWFGSSISSSACPILMERCAMPSAFLASKRGERDSLISFSRQFGSGSCWLGEVPGSVGPERGWSRRTSAPGRPQTNGTGERSSREALEGTRAALRRSGLQPRLCGKTFKHRSFAQSIAKSTMDRLLRRRCASVTFSGPLCRLGCGVRSKFGHRRPKLTR